MTALGRLAPTRLGLRNDAHDPKPLFSPSCEAWATQGEADVRTEAFRTLPLVWTL